MGVTVNLAKSGGAVASGALAIGVTNTLCNNKKESSYGESQIQANAKVNSTAFYVDKSLEKMVQESTQVISFSHDFETSGTFKTTVLS